MSANDRATSYAQDVVAGRVVCGKLHRLACQRHLSDLARQRSADFPYYYDEEAAERVIEYAETLTIAEGAEPKPVRLIPSQVFDFSMLFGWRKVAGGHRRFRRSYLSMARQNGKSFFNGILGTYIAGFSGYRFGKIFTVAVRKRQARIAWEEMSKFIQIDPDLGELFDVKDYKSTIIAKETGCEIMALSREAGLEDGHRSIFCSVDEIHQHRDNAVYKALYNGQRSLPEALTSMITTRGKELNSFCFEMDKYCRDILSGLSTAPDFYVDIYALDEGDDIWEERNWVKSNPFLCRDPEKMNTLRQDARTARDMGGMDLADFICKSLNMWVRNTEDQYVDPDTWGACGSERSLADVVRDGFRDCWVGLDLSSGGDLTSMALEFPLGGGKYYIYSHSFMPRGRQEEHVKTDIAPYDLWEQQGLLTVTGGETSYMTDYQFIIKHLAELREHFGLNYLGIGIDPHNAAGIMQDLEAFGCPVAVITQSARNLNDATVAVRLLVKERGIEYDRSNELLTWSMANATVVKNSFDEIKIDKRDGAKFKRIDCTDAVIDAHALMLVTTGGDVAPDIASDLDDYLAMMGWS
jgi:phage terminase large subunit-like protein